MSITKTKYLTGDKVYFIAEGHGQWKKDVVCSKCNGKGEIKYAEHRSICNKCCGSGIIPRMWEKGKLKVHSSIIEKTKIDRYTDYYDILYKLKYLEKYFYEFELYSSKEEAEIKLNELNNGKD